MINPSAPTADHELGCLMPFKVETDAVAFVVRRLSPFLKNHKLEPRLRNGLRPDIGIRLKSLPEIPICIEVKAFRQGGISPLPEAIAQASTYADTTKYAAFVAPLVGAHMDRFIWNRSVIGAAILVGGQFNVGGLYFSSSEKNGGIAGMILGGAQVAFFSFDAAGDPCTRLHSEATHLLRAKQRSGSTAWR